MQQAYIYRLQLSIIPKLQLRYQCTEFVELSANIIIHNEIRSVYTGIYTDHNRYVIIYEQQRRGTEHQAHLTR